MLAFLSYQTADKVVAGKVAAALDSLGIQTFLAHDDINVSEEWRLALLDVLGRADLFVPILSSNYFPSVWCAQESGIAAFRQMTIVPLTIDATVPLGFINHVQATKIDPNNPNKAVFFPALARQDISFLIDRLIVAVSKSGGFRHAEANFSNIQPYLDRATKDQIVRLLTVSTENNQVCHAGLCVKEYLPPLMKSHGRFMNPRVRKRLKDTLAIYNRN